MTTISTTRNNGASGPPLPAQLQSVPDRNCPLCPRLADFRAQIRAREPDWFNSPVPPFGDAGGSLLIVGLAPGLKGANRTGRPFTGDYAGDLLYATLLEYGFAKGTYQAQPDDGLALVAPTPSSRTTRTVSDSSSSGSQACPSCCCRRPYGWSAS